MDAQARSVVQASRLRSGQTPASAASERTSRAVLASCSNYVGRCRLPLITTRRCRDGMIERSDIGHGPVEGPGFSGQPVSRGRSTASRHLDRKPDTRSADGSRAKHWNVATCGKRQTEAAAQPTPTLGTQVHVSRGRAQDRTELRTGPTGGEGSR